jgi:hypothetical protein
MTKNAAQLPAWPLVAAGLLAFLMLTACGRKTLPIPPHEAVPEAIRDLRFQQDESLVVLTWTYPKVTTVGTKLPVVESFLVLRAVVPEQEYCPGCPVTFSSAEEVKAAQAITDSKRRQARYTETVLRPGHRYLYQVQTKAGWRVVSEPSNMVSFSWDSPAMAPDELTTKTGDGRAILNWLPVTTLINGQAVASPILYQVYRGPAPETFRPVGEPVAETTYEDSGLVNGLTYYYHVRAARNSGDTRLIGLASHVVTVTPRDLTPPTPPRGLTGVVVAGGVKLLWERGTEKDLAGYRIYRRLPDEARPTRIGEVDRAEITFIDQLPQAPGGCYWSITAYDKAEPTNESVFSKELYHEPF